MFKSVKRYETGLDSIPISLGVKYTLCFVGVPNRIPIDSKPNRNGKTFPLIRFNNVKLVDYEIVKKSIIDDKVVKILEGIELGTISNLDLTKKMSNLLMDTIDKLSIEIGSEFILEKIEGKESEFDNTIKITKK